MTTFEYLMNNLDITKANLKEYVTGSYPEISVIMWDAGQLDSNVLKNFPNLKELYCSNNGLRDLKELEFCTGLQILYCADNPLDSLAGLESCTQLLELYCPNCNLRSLDGIQSCAKLEKLFCFRNKLANLKGLEACTKLQELYCYRNKLVNLQGIESCVQLRKLNCSENRLLSLKGIESCTQLRILNCVDNKLTSLEGLSSCAQLQELFCYSNKLVSLKELRSCTELRELSCSINKLVSLEGIEACTQLTELHCHTNKLTSLKELRSCAQLQRLNCSRNKLTSLEDIESCTQLRELYFVENQVTSLRSLIYLQRLVILRNGDNPLNAPTIQEQRFLARLAKINSNTSIYSDKQNVHNTTIQISICNSVRNLINDPKPKSVVIDELNVSNQTKELLEKYCKDETEHSVLLISYKELLDYVVARLTTTEMLKVFEQEILDSKDLCFTGRFNRTVNALAGFYPDIEIQISEPDRLSAIIEQIRNTELPENQSAKAKQVLKELGYDNETIDIWTDDLTMD